MPMPRSAAGYLQQQYNEDYAHAWRPEICAAAIFRTGAGLCAGPRLCPAELSAAGIVKQRHQR